MTATAALRLEVLKDKSYQSTRLGRDIADFLVWGEIGGWSQKTLINYEGDLVRPAKALALLGKAPDELTGSDLLRIAQAFQPASRRTRMAAWRSFFKWCRRTRRVLMNPCEELPDMKAAPPTVKEILGDAQIEALLSLPLIDRAPLAVLIEAGLRKDEMSKLTLRHCQPESGRILVLKSKGDKSRVVPMSPRLQTILADLVLVERLNPDDHILYAVKGNQHGTRKILRDRHIGAATFARWWARCCADAGVEYRPRFTLGPEDRGVNNPHVTRHTCATRWRQQGMALDDIQDLLGHSSIHTTEQLYVHTKVIDIERRMRELGLAV